MLKTIVNMIAGALIAAAVGTAFAVVGTPPGTGPALVDGTWLNGLANGQNNSYQSGIATAGTSNATATQLPSGFMLLEVDSATNASANSASGVILPPCTLGTVLSLYNATATSFTVYPYASLNPANATSDTINSLTSIASATAHTALEFACAKMNNWSAK